MSGAAVDRLAMLRQMAEGRPDDPFPSYGLAMELRKQGQREQARDVFETLMERHPDYVATYLMAGNLWEELGDRDRARAIYARGMDVARAAGDEHTLEELGAAHAGLG